VIKIVKVRGESMLPTFAPDDYLILTKARALRSGFVVLVDHPKYGTIVKRVKSVAGDAVTLEGDNLSESTSSEDMGDVPLKHIRGRVRWSVKPGFFRLKSP